METLDFDSDPLLKLLAEALRAGPGSPAWHEAVGRINAPGNSDSDQYKLLLEARERLESGKAYRQIHAGPAFTGRVLAAVDVESNHPKSGFLNATSIAVIGGIVLIVSAIIIISLLATSTHQTLADLQKLSFTQDIVDSTFRSGIGGSWKPIGSVSLNGAASDQGLRPAGADAGPEFRGGGIVTVVPIRADESASVDVVFRPAQPCAGVEFQVFISDQPDFDAKKGVSPHELLWALQPIAINPNKLDQRQQVVLPDGTFAGVSPFAPPARDTVALHLIFDMENCIVNCNGSQLYAGPNKLNDSSPRFVGIRFLRKGIARPAQLPGVMRIHITRP